jgi:DNA-binding MarR family transcriptional regulator
MSHETLLLEELAAHTRDHHVDVAAERVADAFLFPRNAEKLDWFLRELSDIMHRGRNDDPYMLGFRDALFGLCESYYATLREENEQAHAVELTRKSGWRPILQAIIDTGQGRPSELAALTGMDPAQVSRALAEMREAELVAVHAPPDGADRRTKPHVITSLGISALQRLGPAVPASFDKAFELAAAVFARLATDRRVTERTAAELAKQILPSPNIAAAAAAKTLLEAAARRGLVVEQEGAHLGADLSAQGAVYRLLIDALDKHRSPAFLDAVAGAASPKQNRLVVRSARPHDLWHIFFKRVNNPFGGRPVIVDGADLIVGSVEPPAEPYALLYESASLLKDDHAAAVPAMRKLEQRAARRLCLTSPTLVELDKGYEAIPVAA